MKRARRRPTRVVDLLNPAAVLLPAANVIMQLSAPGVGYGVVESPVDSGNVYKHPFKRARSTGTYLAVATIGTESDRALIRAAVDTVPVLLQARTNDDALMAYSTLWSLEFKAHPASEYEGVRKQVADDLKRLRALNLDTRRMWYYTLGKGYKLANDGQDTRAIQQYLGHRNIQHTTRYTDLAPNRFKNFWRDWGWDTSLAN